MKTHGFLRLAVIAALVAIIGVGTSLVAGAGEDEFPLTARGGGATMVRGGTGDPSFTPVITTFSFSWRDGKGGFECLALVPNASAGTAGSGVFDTNAMYVTGKITSATVDGDELVLVGIATVTGVGEGSHRSFRATATRGGPGATLVLKVSGLTFSEILTEGEIDF
jgi:hypothetical protein